MDLYMYLFLAIFLPLFLALTVVPCKKTDTVKMVNTVVSHVSCDS